MRNKAFVFSAIVVVGALLALAPTAAADPPVRSEQHFDRTRTATGLCPFPIVIHSEGTFTDTVFSDGKDVTHAVAVKITYTNPANGRSVSTVLAGPFIVEPNGDGTVTVTIHGNDAHETVPGQGTIYASVGTLVYIADAAANEVPLTILKSTGQQDPAQFPVTCDGLS